MYLVIYYVPGTHLNKVKTAMFKAGAGRIGKYDSCSWETKGHGQFRPLEGSTPFLGSKNRIERVEEYKVEMVCRNDKVKSVLRALIDAHPYEEPAYHAIEVMTLEDLNPSEN